MPLLPMSPSCRLAPYIGYRESMLALDVHILDLEMIGLRNAGVFGDGVAFHDSVIKHKQKKRVVVYSSIPDGGDQESSSRSELKRANVVICWNLPAGSGLGCPREPVGLQGERSHDQALSLQRTEVLPRVTGCRWKGRERERESLQDTFPDYRLVGQRIEKFACLVRPKASDGAGKVGSLVQGNRNVITHPS